MHTNTIGRFFTRQGEVSSHPYPMSGIIAGSLILTGQGVTPVEFLKPGDRLISRVRGMVKVSGVEARTEVVDLVRIEQGALGAQKPDQATLMPTTQQVLVRGPRAVEFAGTGQTVRQVGELVDGKTITRVGTRETRLFRLFFDRAEVIYSDGIEIAVATEVATHAQAA